MDCVDRGLPLSFDVVLIGILSDTHDRSDACAAALRVLREAGADVYIHCGDVGSEAVLDQLAGLKSVLVWGNNDYDIGTLTRYAEEIGIQVLGNSGRIKLAGKDFLIAHGDRAIPINDAMENQDCDYILHGHTHVRRDEHVGKTHIINPGALHRASRKSVATLEPETGALRFAFVDI